MIILKSIILFLAFAISFLWVTKLITDAVSAIFGGQLTPENAKKDGILRIYMILSMSLFWTLTIIL